MTQCITRIPFANKNKRVRDVIMQAVIGQYVEFGVSIVACGEI